MPRFACRRGASPAPPTPAWSQIADNTRDFTQLAPSGPRSALSSRWLRESCTSFVPGGGRPASQKTCSSGRRFVRAPRLPRLGLGCAPQRCGRSTEPARLCYGTSISTAPACVGHGSRSSSRQAARARSPMLSDSVTPSAQGRPSALGGGTPSLPPPSRSETPLLIPEEFVVPGGVHGSGGRYVDDIHVPAGFAEKAHILFQLFDLDCDMRLDYDELSALLTAAAGQAWDDKELYIGWCQRLGCSAKDGLSNSDFCGLLGMEPDFLDEAFEALGVAVLTHEQLPPTSDLRRRLMRRALEGETAEGVASALCSCWPSDFVRVIANELRSIGEFTPSCASEQKSQRRAEARAVISTKRPVVTSPVAVLHSLMGHMRGFVEAAFLAVEQWRCRFEENLRHGALDHSAEAWAKYDANVGCEIAEVSVLCEAAKRFGSQAEDGGEAGKVWGYVVGLLRLARAFVEARGRGAEALFGPRAVLAAAARQADRYIGAGLTPVGASATQGDVAHGAAKGSRTGSPPWGRMIDRLAMSPALVGSSRASSSLSGRQSVEPHRGFTSIPTDGIDRALVQVAHRGGCWQGPHHPTRQLDLNLVDQPDGSFGSGVLSPPSQSTPYCAILFEAPNLNHVPLGATPDLVQDTGIARRPLPLEDSSTADDMGCMCLESAGENHSTRLPLQSMFDVPSSEHEGGAGVLSPVAPRELALLGHASAPLQCDLGMDSHFHDNKMSVEVPLTPAFGVPQACSSSSSSVCLLDLSDTFYQAGRPSWSFPGADVVIENFRYADKQGEEIREAVGSGSSSREASSPCESTSGSVYGLDVSMSLSLSCMVDAELRADAPSADLGL